MGKKRSMPVMFRCSRGHQIKRYGSKSKNKEKPLQRIPPRMPPVLTPEPTPEPTPKPRKLFPSSRKLYLPEGASKNYMEWTAAQVHTWSIMVLGKSLLQGVPGIHLKEAISKMKKTNQKIMEKALNKVINHRNGY